MSDTAKLLTDGAGVYGVELAGQCAYRGAYRLCLGTRPDRLDETTGNPILQPIPRLFRRCTEGKIADGLFTALLARAGLSRFAHSRGWWSDTPAGQAANRRKYHALKRSAVAITNSLVRQALTAAPPDALKIARRFPWDSRFDVYRAICRSPRMLQLAETFPLLAGVIAGGLCCRNSKNNNTRAERAAQLVEAGARLNAVAECMGVSTALRKVRPGAIGSVLMALNELRGHEAIADDWERGPWFNASIIHASMPGTTSGQRLWWRALYQAAAIGGPYLEWVARNALGLRATTAETVRTQVQDLGDWVANCYVAEISEMPAHVLRALAHGNYVPARESRCITRRFSPDMSIATVRELCGAWHDAVSLSRPGANVELPAPWRDAETVSGLAIVPLATVADIAAEARAMHHCAASDGYIGKVRSGASYFYSVRDGDKRIATVEVERFNGTGVSIAQMRGPCNAILPKPLQTRLSRWVRRGNWVVPKAGGDLSAPRHFADDLDLEIPF
jgi:hypothetical protein